MKGTLIQSPCKVSPQKKGRRDDVTRQGREIRPSEGDIQSDIAQLEELRARAKEGGQVDWVQRIDVQLAKLRKKLGDVLESGKS